jgi:2-polyprenyl-6-methoxyphenol hydroxylase-like FAD-dependent oxidoreductase
MADGISLAQQIQKAGKSQDISDALRGYEEEMRPRATAAVLDSRAGAYEANAVAKAAAIA